MALVARPEPAAELITLSEAARLAGVHRDTVRAWCARGDLPSQRQGARREVRLRRADLARLLDERSRHAAPGSPAPNGVSTSHGAHGLARAAAAARPASSARAAAPPPAAPAMATPAMLRAA